jgi:hypothetical protein
MVKSEETCRVEITTVFSSSLRDVIPVVKEITAHNVRVEILAIEVRAGGSILHWKAYGLAGQELFEPAVFVRGRTTDYRTEAVSIKGSNAMWECTTLVIPDLAPRDSIRIVVTGLTGEDTPNAQPEAPTHIWEIPFVVPPIGMDATGRIGPSE